MKRFFWIFVLPCLLLAGLYFGGVYAYKNRLHAPVSKMMSDEMKDRLKNTVLVFQRQAELEQEVAGLERQIEQLGDVQEFLETALLENPNLPDSLPFSYVGEQLLETSRDRFSVVSYETPFVPLDYFGRRAYLEVHGDDLLLISAKGTVGRVALDEITGDGFSMTVQQSNLPEMITDPEFFDLSELSIKDALVAGDRLLLSYTKTLPGDCVTLAIAGADLTAETLTFRDVFVPGECIAKDNDYEEFSANQSGGRMLATGPQTLLFSLGEMRYRDLSQDPDSIFGKVVEVDLADGSWVAKSMGHRNPQGLYYDPEANLIVVSEHGPMGGDEININRTPNGEPKNYGWPVSSYGEHYSTDQSFYDKAPLYKSHAEHGFVEPDLHFETSLSPGQILRVGPDPRDPDRYSLLMGTMGTDYREGDESLHVFDLDENYEIVSQEHVVLDDRVRDMIRLPGPNRYALFLEGAADEFGTIALVTMNP